MKRFTIVMPLLCWLMMLSVQSLAGDHRSGPMHWAFQPLAEQALPMKVPSEKDQWGRIRTPIDRFILERLSAAGLGFAPDASPRTLLRRAYLDLVGLPPGPDELDAVLSIATDPDDYERLLDRLLDSPHFGERWGRHWLDVTGYTDAVGYEQDARSAILANGKWRYRHYVIRSFNADKPYDQFLTEQIAGDEMVDWRDAEAYTPEIRELLVATGYLRTAPDYTHEYVGNITSNRFNVLFGTLEIVGNSLLGLTINCARCHSHKFDPIPQEDYYRMMALFTPAYNPQDWLTVIPFHGGDEVVDPQAKPREIADESARHIAQRNQETEQRIAALNRQAADLRSEAKERLLADRLASVPEPMRAEVKEALELAPEQRNENQEHLASKFESTFSVTDEQVEGVLTDTEKRALADIDKQTASLNESKSRDGRIQALYDVGPPPATHLLNRGNFDSPGPEVSPGFLSVLSDAHSESLLTEVQSKGQTSGRRLALATWLTDPDSPASALVARVMVNRIWQHLFGAGLVPTPDNFGVGGSPPTHPELLEWLSSELIRGGWRIKPIIRLIMTSTAYRQSSRIPVPAMPGSVDALTVDPDNQLLWRMRLRRLESEVIRDSILAVSGMLVDRMGGPPIRLKTRSDGMIQVAGDDSGSKRRRSIYLLARRTYHLSLLGVFDQPVIAINCVHRDTSAVPLQSLMMMNDAFLFEQAAHFANRAVSLAGATSAQPIEVAFRLALARRPTSDETEKCLSLLERQAVIYRESGLSQEEAEQKALAQLCHTLLNTSEFLYVD